MSSLIGTRVCITSGLCAGQLGVIRGAKEHPARADTALTEYQIEFSPPLRLPGPGSLNAVWLKPSDFAIVAKTPAKVPAKAPAGAMAK
jgi:hypothetical protein